MTIQEILDRVENTFYKAGIESADYQETGKEVSSATVIPSDHIFGTDAEDEDLDEDDLETLDDDNEFFEETYLIPAIAELVRASYEHMDGNVAAISVALSPHEPGQFYLVLTAGRRPPECIESNFVMVMTKI